MDNATLKQLMDPKFQISQAKYENYRIAVDKAYKLAFDLTPYDLYIGDEGGKAKRKDLTMEERTAELVKGARILIPAIYSDLEKAIEKIGEK